LARKKWAGTGTEESAAIHSRSLIVAAAATVRASIIRVCPVLRIDRGVNGDAPAPALLQGRALRLALRPARAASVMPRVADQHGFISTREFKSLSSLAMNAFFVASARLRGIASGLGHARPRRCARATVQLCRAWRTPSGGAGRSDFSLLRLVAQTDARSKKASDSPYIFG
jgi:hypothetical protein